MMPGDVKYPVIRLKMDHLDYEIWKQTQGILVPVIAGCIDYVFGTDEAHHKLGFLLEIDRRGTDANPFRAIKPSEGEVPKGEIMFDENPTLPWDIN